ncbi:MAG TPA: hypothetical protein VJH37_04860 [Candidatus Nanoarchaeia archaeon]|nr:hypothetical protein [Candidatus Nanoarchaeia archaeon]
MEVVVEKEKHGKFLFEKNIENIEQAPFYIDGIFIMKNLDEVSLKLHIGRDGLTNFEPVINDKKLQRTISDDEYVLIILNKEYIKKGENILNITLKDSLDFDVSYPSFGEYPLTIFNDTKIISDKISSIKFTSLQYNQKTEEINCEQEEYNKDQCLIAKAIKERDPKICDNMSSEHNRIACQIQMATATNYPEVCAQIENINIRTNCYLELAIQYKNNEYCERAMRDYYCW